MESGNLFQTKRILNMNNNDFSSSVRDTNFNKYNNLFSETNYSNYRRDRDLFYNSLNNFNNINNISTSFSSFDKTNYNNPYRINKSRSRSRSPCFCGCHPYEDCINHLKENCPLVCPREQLMIDYSNSLEKMNEDMSKKNDDLVHEIVNLKKNLQKMETELDRTKNEKEACDYYIKQLENELSKSNRSNDLQNSKQRANNYSKMRDYEKYHDMLNKSFKVLDSVSNQCTNPKGKTKGGVNYYINRGKDYDSVIKTQKNFIDNLPMSLSNSENNNNDNDNDNDRYVPNKYQSDFNIYKYPEGYTNLSSSMGNVKNKTYDINNNSQNNIKPKRSYNSNNNLNISTKETYPKEMYSKFNNYSSTNKSSSNPKRIIKPYQSNFFPKHIMYETSKGKNNNIRSPYHRNNSEPKINSKIANNKISPKERYLVTDKFGNPIFIQGKRVLAMELMPYIDEDGNEHYDNNGNLLFIGPNGEQKSEEDLQPIILDNNLPLVNEQNRPLLGIDNVIMVDRFGKPILGPGELYDVNNKVVKGELGILPKTKQGNLVKLNINKEPLIKNKEDNNSNYKTPKQRLNKGDKPTIKNKNNYSNSNKNPLGLKPLIGKDGKPIRDSNNNPIILDKNGNPVQDPNLTLLLDKSGFPVLNTLGSPIILDKNQEPLDNKYKIKARLSSAKGKKQKTKKNKKGNSTKKIKTSTGKFNNTSTEYPKPNPSFQRKIEILPERSNRFELNNHLSNCFACDLGCSVSRSGYSPMTYSPYNNSFKRRDLTPYK